MKTSIRYSIKFNRSHRTYTIRVYDGNRVISKFRSLPQGKDYHEYFSQSDIVSFLKHNMVFRVL